MPRIYARREDNDKRVLVALQCDRCGEEIKPSDDKDGWTKGGTIETGWREQTPQQHADNEWINCPRCS